MTRHSLVTIALVIPMLASAAAAQTGACCLPPSQGLCIVMTEAECLAAGGTFAGPGTTCAGVGPLAGSALDFDGLDDSVTGENHPAQAFTASFTVEAWVRPDSLSSSPRRYVSRGGPGQGGWGVGAVNGRLRFTTYGVRDYDTAGSYLTPGRWTHIAVMLDSSFQAWFYVNGSLVELIGGTAPAANSAAPLRIGRHGTQASIEAWDGAIDEVRMWGVERSDVQIAEDFDDTLSGGESGLVAYYRFDEGSGTSATDLSPTGVTGDVSGAEWISTELCGSATRGACCLPDGSCAMVSQNGCLQSGGTYRGDGTSCDSAACPQPGACCLTLAQGLCLTVQADQCAAMGGMFRGEGTSCDTIGPISGAALEFDNEGDEVSAAVSPALNLTTGYTLEAWVRPDNLDAVRRVMSKRDTGGGYGLAALAGGRLRFTRFGLVDHDTPGAYLTVGHWTHIAVTFGAGATFYVNGQAVQTVGGGGTTSIVAAPFTIGRNPTPFPDIENWVGAIDEVRVWNILRSSTEIAGSFMNPLTGSEPGLVGYWRLDEGSGTAAMDSSPSGAHATFFGQPEWLVVAPCCAADFDGDGFVTGLDFDAFVAAFEAGDFSSDFDHDGFVTGLDFDAYVIAFEAGC